MTPTLAPSLNTNLLVLHSTKLELSQIQTQNMSSPQINPSAVGRILVSDEETAYLALHARMSNGLGKPKAPTLVGTFSRGAGPNQEHLDITFSAWKEHPNMGCFSFPAGQEHMFRMYSSSFSFLCDVWAIYNNIKNNTIDQVFATTSTVNIPYTEFAFKQSWDHNMETIQWNAKRLQHHFTYPSIISHLAELGNLNAAMNMLYFMERMCVVDAHTLHHLRQDIQMFFQPVDLTLSANEFKQLPRAVMGKPLLKRLGKEIPEKVEDYPVCVICMENIKSRQHCTVLDCGHLYHVGCARQWFTEHCEKPTCPCCRAEVQVTRDSSDTVDIQEPPNVVRRLNFDDMESDDGSGYDSMPPLVDEYGNEIDDDIPDEELMAMMDRVEANLRSQNAPPENVSEQPSANTEPIPLSSLENFTQEELAALDEEIWNTLIRIDGGLQSIYRSARNGTPLDATARNLFGSINNIISNHLSNVTPRSRQRTENMRRSGPSTNV